MMSLLDVLTLQTLGARNLAFKCDELPIEKVEEIARQLLATVIDKQLWLTMFWDIIAKLEAIKASGAVYGH
jgi:hypothetical protein